MPSTRIISFTVTEAGYYLDAKNRLDLSFPDLAADVAAAKQGKPGGTIYAALTAILRERMRRSGGKVTLLNCDNLRHNGERFRGGLLQFIALLNDTAVARLGDGQHQQPERHGGPHHAAPDARCRRAREARDRLGRRRARDERELHSMGDRGRLLQRPAGVGAGRRGDGRIGQPLRGSEDPHPEREPQRASPGRARWSAISSSTKARAIRRSGRSRGTT